MYAVLLAKDECKNINLDFPYFELPVSDSLPGA